jgi:hypothetical protein
METTTELTTLAGDIGKDVELGKKLVAAYKAGGKNALISALPEAIPLLQAEFADVRAALPQIKAGYKTTEFWLTAAVVLGNGAYTTATGKTLPFDLNVTVAALVGVYALVRTIVKKPAVAAPPPAK